MAKPNKEAQPECIALGMERKDGGWVVVSYNIQGDRVIKRVETPADLKAIAMESFRVKAVREVFNK